MDLKKAEQDFINNIQIPVDFKYSLELPFHMYRKSTGDLWFCDYVDRQNKDRQIFHKFSDKNGNTSDDFFLKDMEEAKNILFQLKEDGYEPILYPKFRFKIE